MPTVEVVRTYLELARREALRPARCADPALRLDAVAACPVAFYRFLYAEVGRLYHWVDRLGWSDDDVRAHLARPEVSVHVLYRGGAPAGYFELRRCDDGSIEIAYLGVLPEFQGHGLGKHLLTCAVEAAFARGASRVWLHTCTLDHPGALPNYEKRGFRPYRRETYTADVEAAASA